MSLLEDNLRLGALEVSRNAYCPYSKFHVGCALVDDRGVISFGCNVENASYGLTICSERNALFQMAARGGKKFTRLVVVCPDAGDDAPAEYKMPCGACRQVMAEFAAEGAIIEVVGVGEFTMTDLLPSPFKI